ncbi:lysosome-associated membrane glycoprotein 3 [Chanos chanos]|uniref:Lysosome-associated membrane glycoprotein 3 n=1 Tax=Chanos chanos TaxID=29144 RepID=A0A6J2WN39_CHACN|nr:lysosome-associated membrane glycoprotein 3 [Chanos chanos]
MTGSSFGSEAGDSMSSGDEKNQAFIESDDVMPPHGQFNTTQKPVLKPILKPKESKPTLGTYTLIKNGKTCVRASLGVEFIVEENKTKSYFNLDPRKTRATGYCGGDKALLSLDFEGGNVQFTFYKEGNVYYVKTLKTFLNPAPPRKGSESKYYPGVMDHEKLFKADKGLSFKCKSHTTFPMSQNLWLKFVPLQIQAFDFGSGKFGKEVECWADYMKRIVPIIVGAVVVGLCLIAVLVYVLVREHRKQGYEQL